MFPDAPSIAPFLEHPKTGPTASFCAELAKRLNCVVVAGYPERLSAPDGQRECSSSSTDVVPTPTSTHGHTPPSGHALIGANAALVYDSTPTLIHTYRKSNLFPTDLTWARPGDGFTALDLPAPLGRIAVAICNDLNVRAGEAWVSIEQGPYELAGWCRREGVRVLVLLNAWLKPEDGGVESVEEGGRGEESEDADGVGRERDRKGARAGASVDRDGGNDEADSGVEEDGEDGMEPNWRVLNYWATRLRPLWAVFDAKTDAEEGTRQSETSGEAMHGSEDQDVIVIVCNRFGNERGTHVMILPELIYGVHFSL